MVDVLRPAHLAQPRSTAAKIACSSSLGFVNCGQWPVGRSMYSASRMAASSATYVFLRTLYVLFFIEISSRKLRFFTSTANPDARFVTQQARNLSWELQDQDRSVRFLIRDRDAKYTG